MRKFVIISVLFLISGCSFGSSQNSGDSVFVSDIKCSAENIQDADFAEFDNKGFGWGFKKIKGSPPDIDVKTKELFEKYNAFYMDENEGKSLYLTFDEGYENGYTSQILDVLKNAMYRRHSL